MSRYIICDSPNLCNNLDSFKVLDNYIVTIDCLNSQLDYPPSIPDSDTGTFKGTRSIRWANSKCSAPPKSLVEPSGGTANSSGRN